MILAKAIARSAGNKAKALTDEGCTVIVQQRYAGVAETWLHVWFMNVTEVVESDLPLPGGLAKLDLYGVDPDESYWSSI